MSCALFLDVLGVLVHKDSEPNGSKEPFGSSFHYAQQVDPECVRRVMRIVEATGATIVITSDWRLRMGSMGGLERAFLWALPDMRGRSVRDLIQERTPKDTDRSLEISKWLAEHSDVNRYVVLDDNWVEVHPQVTPLPDFGSGGLLDTHVAEAIRMLQGD